MSQITNIEDQLRRDEGEKLYVYKDHLGYYTIGIGILVDQRKGGGITKEESSYLFKNRLASKREELLKKLPWVNSLDDVRQGALLNMSFQMGVAGVVGFKNSLALIKDGKYKEAATAMLRSKWAKQTPERAGRITKQIETGEWQ